MHRLVISKLFDDLGFLPVKDQNYLDVTSGSPFVSREMTSSVAIVKKKDIYAIWKSILIKF